MYRAVKVVRREDFEYEKTFEREFEGIQRYEKVSQGHPGLIDVLHVGRDSEADFYYYVMELADDESGEALEWDDMQVATYRPRTLASSLRHHKPCAIQSCVDLGVAIGGALGHLHQSGLIHRDVKPANIIFVKGQPKLADVGLVASLGQRTYVGTEGYVPPEGPGSSAADLFSLAMVLYEMHTGKDRLDFPDLPTNLEIPPSVNRDEWRALNTVICRAGSPDVRKRYDSADSLVEALESVCSAPWRSPRPKRGIAGVFFMTVAVMGLLAIAGGAGYFLWNDHKAFMEKNGPLLSDQSDATGVNGARFRTPVKAISPVGNQSEAAAEAGMEKSGPEQAEGGRKVEDSGGNMEKLDGEQKPRLVADSDKKQKDDHSKAENAKLKPKVETSVTKLAEETPPPSKVAEQKSEKEASKVVEKKPGKTVESDKTTESVKPSEPEKSAEPPMLVATEVKPTAPETPVMPLKAQVVEGGLRITSQPPGARVLHEGKEIGTAGSEPLKFPVGPIELVLRLAGYRDSIFRGEIGEGIQEVHVEMRPDLGPIIGQPWTNSLGMAFVPEADRHESVLEVSVASFDRFLDASGEQIPASGLQGIVHVPEERGRWQFCDWLTAQERGMGLLSDRQYYRPNRSSSDAKRGSFFLSVEHDFGTLAVNSEPPGAQVWRGKQKLGETPVILNDQRLGYYDLTLYKPGYKEITVTGDLTTTELKDVVIPMEADPSASSGPSASAGARVENSQGMVMVPIEGIAGLLVATTETPLGAYMEYLADRGATVDLSRSAAEGSYPASGVSYTQAVAFCDWLTQRERATGRISDTQRYRLPTDREWSRFIGIGGEAGRTPEERGREATAAFLWGEGFPPPVGAGNFADESARPRLGDAVIAGYSDGFATTAPVGSFGPRSNGLFDLAGNVWEWVQDAYGTEPNGMGVMRGGAWDSSSPEVLSASYRNPVPLDSTTASNGFRYVLESRP